MVKNFNSFDFLVIKQLPCDRSNATVSAAGGD